MKVFLRDDIEQMGQTEVDELLLRLPEWRREQALRFKHLSGRRECASAFLLLADALRSEYGITHISPFLLSDHGKPSLVDHPDIHFNLSHCRSAVLCVIDDSPVGCDVETIRTVRPSLLAYTMSAEERAFIESSPNTDLAFTMLWTRKEALLKLTGEGVGSAMHHILLPERLADARIHIDTTICEGYVYSVARKL